MALGAMSLQDVLKAREPLGASRLTIRQCFAPERIVTLVFGVTHIQVEVFGPKRGSYARISNVSGPGELDWEAGEVLDDNAPGWARSWGSFRSFSLGLDACRNVVCDGAQYAHELCGIDCRSTVVWGNPHWLKNPQQMTVIRGYIEVVDAAGLHRLIGACEGPGFSLK